MINTIPDTLTIIINTRVRGIQKIKYEPYMTIPKDKNGKVYFNPLIQLKKSVIDYIPYGYPQSEIYTQFFHKNEFDSLISRTVSSGTQKKRDLATATKDKVVDKNIRLTLDTLFKRGAPFYIGSQRYTVYSYDWDEGDRKLRPVLFSGSQQILANRILNRDRFGNIPFENQYSMNPYPPYQFSRPYDIPMVTPINTTAYNDFYKKLKDIDPDITEGNIPDNISKIKQNNDLSNIISDENLGPVTSEQTKITSFPATPGPIKPEAVTKTPIRPIPVTPMKLVPVTPSTASSTNASTVSTNFTPYNEVTPARSRNEVTPARTENQVTPARSRNEVTPARTENQVTPASISTNQSEQDENLPHTTFKLPSEESSSQQPSPTKGSTTLFPEIDDTGKQPTVFNFPRNTSRSLFEDSPQSSSSEEEQQLSHSFKSYYYEGYEKGLISTKPNDTNISLIQNWKIIKNEAAGDCLFETVRDILNGYNASSSTPKIEKKDYMQNGLYTVKLLRTLVADNINKEMYDNMVISSKQSVSSADTKVRWKFMINSNGSIKTQPETKEAIKKCATEKYRDVNEEPLQPQDYYWGDEISFDIFEKVFDIKFVVIDTKGNTKKQVGSYVSFENSEKEKDYGNIVQMSNDSKRCFIEKNNYEVITKKLENITLENRYTINCKLSSSIKENVNLFGFILYSGNNHYEALYQKGFKNPSQDNYLLEGENIPSYIIYMIFSKCYKVISNDTNRKNSEYGKTSLGKKLEDLMKVYTAKKENPESMNKSNKRLVGGAQDPPIAIASPLDTLGPINATDVRPIYENQSPQVLEETRDRPFPTRKNRREGSNSTQSTRRNRGYVSELTYYIVIDLELYPGDRIPPLQMAALGCESRYEKIRKSYADVFGYVYRPNEYTPPISKLIRGGSTSKHRNKKIDNKTRKRRV
jgi:hypothetical protein